MTTKRIPILLRGGLLLPVFLVLPAAARGEPASPPGVYLDDARAAEPTPGERARGFQLFTRNAMRVVFPSALPTAKERVSEISLRGTPGEFEPAVLLVRALRDLRDLTVEVGPLSASAGVIPAAAVEVRSVRYLERDGQERWGTFHDVRMEVPYFLEERPQLAVPAQAVQPFWLTLHVPADAAPGTYRGTARVRASNGGEASIPFSCQVYPFRLDPPDSVLFGMYVAMSGDRRAAAEACADLRAHGMTGVGLTGRDELPLRMQDGEMVIAWNGEGALETNLDALRAAGFPGPVLWLMHDDVARFCERKAPFGSLRFAQLFTSVIRQVQEHGARAGWPEIIYQPVDEPFGHPDRLERGLRLLEILRAIPGVRTETDGVNGDWDRFTEAWYRGSDVLAFHDGPVLRRGELDPEAWEAFHRRAVADGKRIWFYNVDLTGWHPEPLRFMYGFGLAKSGCDGILQWLYMRPVREGASRPYRNPRALQFRLPRTARESGGPTLAYEAAREGIDDYRYLATLRRLVAEARAGGGSAATRVADEVMGPVEESLAAARFDACRGLAVQGDWTGPCEVRGDGTRVLRGDLKLDNGWTFEQYDELRGRIARGIARLQDALAARG